MKLPPAIRRQFQHHGRMGGAERARRLAPATRRAIAREAAVRRWIRVRFGDVSFAALGLPGGALVDQGIHDLAGEHESAASLCVALAAPRLRRESVPLPAVSIHDAELRLYRLLEREHGGLGHARYLAHLRQMTSFANACASARLATHARTEIRRA